MAVVTFSPVGGEMEVDSYGEYVLLDSYLVLEELNKTLKDQIKDLENLVAYYRTTVENKKNEKHTNESNI